MKFHAASKQEINLERSQKTHWALVKLCRDLELSLSQCQAPMNEHSRQT